MSIVERDIEDRNAEATPKEDDPMHEENNIQLSVGSQSYGEQSVTDSCENIKKDHDEEIAKARKILKQNNKIMANQSSNQRLDAAASIHNPSRRITLQQSQNVRGMRTRTRSQSPTYIISPRHFDQTKHSHHQYLRPFRSWLTEIIIENDPRENNPKLMKT